MGEFLLYIQEMNLRSNSNYFYFIEFVVLYVGNLVYYFSPLYFIDSVSNKNNN